MLKKWVLGCVVFFLSAVSLWAQASSDVYYQWGNKLYAQGNYDLCIKYYQAAIQVDPQNWKAYQGLGTCEYRLGQKNEALQDYHQSLAINPNNPVLENFVNSIEPNPNPPSQSVAQTNPPPRRFYRYRRKDALPDKGSVTWSLMINADLDSSDDLINYYGPTFNTNNTTPVGVEFGVGADYTLERQFQVGLNLEGIYKNTYPVSITNNYTGYTESDTWNDLCFGPAVDLKYLIPLSSRYTLIFHGELGYYFLTASWNATYTEGYEYGTASANLNSSSVGELIGVELEWMRWPGVTTDLGLGYRFLNFSTINYNEVGSAGYSAQGTLKNSENGNAFMDFSGFSFTWAIRFF